MRGGSSTALFDEEIAELSEEMLLAVTEDAPTTEIPRQSSLTACAGRGPQRSGLAKGAEARRTIDGGGVYVNNQRQSDAVGSSGLRRPPP
jgi:hypothetical protein